MSSTPSTDKQLTTGVDYTKFLLPAGEVQRTFAENYLQYLFAENRDIPQSDVIQFLHQAQITGANPANKQIYLIKRKVKEEDERGNDVWRKRGTVVFSYQFILAVAAKTGEFAGYTSKVETRKRFDPVLKKWSEDELLASVVVRRANKGEYPYEAWWSEYAGYTSGGFLTGQWKTKPYVMLEKCAIAGALRRAFPEAMSGMYCEEEFSEDDQQKVLDAKVKDEAIEVRAETVVEQRVVSHEKMEHEEERAKVISQIGLDLGALCAGGTIDAKGKTMLDLCGVSKFKDLSTKTLEELRLICEKVAGTLAEKTDRDAQREATRTRNAATNTFKLEP